MRRHAGKSLQPRRGPTPSVLVLNRRYCPCVQSRGRRPCLRIDTMVPVLRMPAGPGAPWGAPLSQDALINCTTDKRRFLGWVRSPFLILQSHAAEGSPSCIIGCPAGAADWARGRRTGNARKADSRARAYTLSSGSPRDEAGRDRCAEERSPDLLLSSSKAHGAAQRAKLRSSPLHARSRFRGFDDREEAQLATSYCRARMAHQSAWDTMV